MASSTEENAPVAGDNANSTNYNGDGETGIDALTGSGSGRPLTATARSGAPSLLPLYRADSLGIASLDPSAGAAVLDAYFGTPLALRSPAVPNGDGATSYFGAPITPSATAPDGMPRFPFPSTSAKLEGSDGAQAYVGPSQQLASITTNSDYFNVPLSTYPGQRLSRLPSVSEYVNRDATYGLGPYTELTDKDSDAASILQAISSPPILTTDENIFEKSMMMPPGQYASRPDGIGDLPPPAFGVAHRQRLAAAGAGVRPENERAPSPLYGLVADSSLPISLPLSTDVPTKAGRLRAARAAGFAGPVTTGHGGTNALSDALKLDAAATEGMRSVGGADMGTSAEEPARLARRANNRRRKEATEDTDLVEQKRMRRRERCRLAATKFRDKKRSEVHELEATAHTFRVQQQLLIDEIDRLRKRAEELQIFLRQHQDCPGLA